MTVALTIAVINSHRRRRLGLSGLSIDRGPLSATA
jgi:hypothetical protein